MKKVITLAVFIIAAFSINAQSDQGRIYKPFKVDVSACFALPFGDGGSKAGGLFAIEPKYAVPEQFAIGLRMEGAAMARVTIINDVEYTGMYRAMLPTCSPVIIISATITSDPLQAPALEFIQ